MRRGEKRYEPEQHEQGKNENSSLTVKLVQTPGRISYFPCLSHFMSKQDIERFEMRS